MSKNKEEKKRKREYNRGRVFVKIMAGILALLMVVGTCATLIYALM